MFDGRLFVISVCIDHMLDRRGVSCLYGPIVVIIVARASSVDLAHNACVLLKSSSPLSLSSSTPHSPERRSALSSCSSCLLAHEAAGGVSRGSLVSDGNGSHMWQYSPVPTAGCSSSEVKCVCSASDSPHSIIQACHRYLVTSQLRIVRYPPSARCSVVSSSVSTPAALVQCRAGVTTLMHVDNHYCACRFWPLVQCEWY